MTRRDLYNEIKRWDEDYSRGESSGPGSEGIYAKMKIDIINKLIEEFRINSILDIGCGDIDWIKNIDIENYTGIDYSEKGINKCRLNRKDWNFIVEDASNIDINNVNDMIICLDVLIHQMSRKQYDKLLNNCFNNFSKCLLISGYDNQDTLPYKYGNHTWYWSDLKRDLDDIILDNKTNKYSISLLNTDNMIHTYLVIKENI